MQNVNFAYVLRYIYLYPLLLFQVKMHFHFDVLLDMTTKFWVKRVEQ